MKISDYLPDYQNIQPDIFIERQIKETGNIKLVTIADAHVGNELFNEKFFQSTIKWAVDNNAYIIGLGDYFENAILHFGATDKLCADDVMDYLADSLMPLKDRFIAFIRGNHDERSMKHQPQVDMSRQLAARLGIIDLYRPNGAVIKLKLGKDFRHSRPLTYWIYGTHGTGGSRTEGGKINALKRMSLNYTFCDLYLMGHHHWVLSDADRIFVPVENSKNNRLESHIRKYALCGTFLDWGGYAERAQFQCGPLSIPTIEFNGKVRDVRVTI